jgi:Ca2+/H+ antiporter
MEILTIALIVSYLLISLCFFINWLNFFKQKHNLAPEDRFLSLVILVIATILWPVAVPISYLELLKARKSQFIVMPVILAIFLVSLLLYLGYLPSPEP